MLGKKFSFSMKYETAQLYYKDESSMIYFKEIKGRNFLIGRIT